MRMTKNGRAVAAGCALVAAGLAAIPAQSKQVVLGYMPASMIYPYNVATAKGFTEEAEALGARVVVFDPQGTIEKQANGLEDFIAQGVDGVAMLALDGQAAQNWVDRADDAGIPFVSLATQVGDWKTREWKDVYPKLSALVGIDNVEAGRVAGRIALGILPKDRVAKIAIVEGAPGYPQVPQRTRGFRETLDAAGARYEIVASQPTNWTAEEGEAVCQNILTAHPDIDLVFSQADPGAIGCSIAARSNGVEVPIISGNGGSKEGERAIEAGEIVGSVCDRPEHLGRLAARALHEAATNSATPKARLIGFEMPITTKATLTACPAEY